MKYNPEIHHRRSIRLKEYDYSQNGAYFVTVCARNGKCLFGNIANGEMALNDAGRMVEKWFYELENKFAEIQCDEMAVMPNHIHFIVNNIATGTDNVGADLRVCPLLRVTGTPSGKPGVTGEHIGSPLRSPLRSPLHSVVRWFKTMTTNEYIRGVKNHGWPRFDGKLWQRNYYEHIIRDEQSLENIRDYITHNPAKWAEDENNIPPLGIEYE
ncbi:MAG: transposase [Syntrophales bacterium]|jgi:REP element-mobilizing transposase RayT|nr:transposase [Syntrophales bacterium]